MLTQPIQLMGGAARGDPQPLSAQDVVGEAVAFDVDLDNPHRILLGYVLEHRTCNTVDERMYSRSRRDPGVGGKLWSLA